MQKGGRVWEERIGVNKDKEKVFIGNRLNHPQLIMEDGKCLSKCVKAKVLPWWN
jgi:hypothetical protein